MTFVKVSNTTIVFCAESECYIRKVRYIACKYNLLIRIL